MNRVALFLGAGASHAFGYPTTREFLHVLASRISGDQKDIISRIRLSPEVSDIEHVLLFLDGTIETSSNKYVRSVFSLEPPLSVPIRIVKVKDEKEKVVYTSKSSLEWGNFVLKCQDLKQSIISELHSQYCFNPSTKQNVVDTYGILFGMLKDLNIFPVEVFTTNYDRVIEEFCLATTMKVELLDGFSTEPRTGRRYWNSDEFKKKGSSESIQLKLFKLHGSLDWRETYDHEIENVRAEERCITARSYRQNILIYPTETITEQKEPFKTVFEHFKDTVSKATAFMVIGFSFRDSPINETFLNFLRADKSRRIIVVSTHARENVKENLLAGIADANTLLEQIRFVPKHFGKTQTFKEIIRALNAIIR
jgi:hypothetical protein